ncbi:MAG: GreA/GreB family elongation factor [Spirochaetia bacterium]|nr:GreA/GreB family elongation factor [Spirochaetota bacterium]MDW8112928.1 GreA/GreB family elongation factor [Spirochaetia bacterium]
MAVMELDYKEEIIKLFNEERLSKHSLDDYSRKDLVKIESIVDQAISLGEDKELLSLCDENIKDNNNSIFALYSAGLILLKKGSIDTYYMPEVLLRFSEHKKVSLSVFIAEKILSYREEKYALKLLEEYYKNENRKDELIDIKERIVRVDTKDAYTAKSLAEYYEEEGNTNKAVYYYKIALERFIQSKNSTSASLTFEKLMSFHSALDVKYVLNISLRMLDMMAHDKIGKLLHKFAIYFKKKEAYDKSLEILKFVISRCTPNDAGVKNDLREVYESIYQNHSLLPKYFNEFAEFMKRRLHSSIRVNYNEIIDKLNELEKKLRFDVGVYVYHKNFGVGIITDIQDDWLVIDFVKKKQHRMYSNIAFYSLDVLSQEDIRVWREYKKDELKKLIQNYSPEVIKMVLISLGGQGNVKEIKEVLSTIIPNEDVSDFWNKVRHSLSQVNVIVSPESKTTYIYIGERKVEEDIKEKINSLPTFEEKIKFIYNFLQQIDTLNVPQAVPIVEFLTNTVLESQNKFEIIEAGILLTLKYSETSREVREKIIHVVSSMNADEVIDFVKAVEMNEVRRGLLNIIKTVFSDWTNVFVRVFFAVDTVRLNNYILSELVSYDKSDAIRDIVDKIINSVKSPAGNRFKVYSKFMWFAKMVFQKEYDEVFKSIGVNKVDVLMTVANIISSIQYSFEERGEKGVSRRIYLMAKEVFSNYQEIERVILESGKDTSFVLLSYIQEFELLEPKELSTLRQKLYYKHPDLKYMEDTRDRRSPYMITKSAYEKIREEYNRLLNEELPKISKMVSTNPTPELLEKEEELKAIIEQLSKELVEYKVINPDAVSRNYVDVGTKVVLKSKRTGEEITYHILGDKEANVEKNIISYRSPFGVKLIDKEVGDTVQINVKGVDEEFQIKSISLSEYV